MINADIYIHLNFKTLRFLVVTILIPFSSQFDPKKKKKNKKTSAMPVLIFAA